MLSGDVLMTFPPLQVRTKGAGRGGAGGDSYFIMNDSEV